MKFDITLVIFLFSCTYLYIHIYTYMHINENSFILITKIITIAHGFSYSNYFGCVVIFHPSTLEIHDQQMKKIIETRF